MSTSLAFIHNVKKQKKKKTTKNYSKFIDDSKRRRGYLRMGYHVVCFLMIRLFIYLREITALTCTV